MPDIILVLIVFILIMMTTSTSLFYSSLWRQIPQGAITEKGTGFLTSLSYGKHEKFDADRHDTDTDTDVSLF